MGGPGDGRHGAGHDRARAAARAPSTSPPGGNEAGGPGYAAWGRIAVGGFDAKAPAEKGTVRLDGEVTTGILGADAEWERWLAGVALSVSEGEGSFDQPGVDSGTVESSLTSVNPYVRYQASDRLSAWGLFGYGTGDMTMTQAARGERAEIVTWTDISMRLGAAGARCVLLKAGRTAGSTLRCAAMRSWCRWTGRRCRTRRTHGRMRAACAWCWRAAGRSRSARARC